MKDLYKILLESIFDTDTNIDDVKNSVFIDMLGKTSFKIGSDGKTIVFDSSKSQWSSFWERRLSFIKHLGSADTIFDKLKSLKNAGLKFQPLAHIQVDPNSIQNVIENLPCDAVVCMEVVSIVDGIKKLDFSKLNYPIVSKLNFHSADIQRPELIQIEAPKQHINIVEFGSSFWRTAWVPESIKGWDCDVLIVKSTGYIDMDNEDIDEEKIQELIDNNPKSKMILFEIDTDKYVQVKTKSAKRTFDRLVGKRFKHDIYGDIEEVVGSWEKSHKELIQ